MDRLAFLNSPFPSRRFISAVSLQTGLLDLWHFSQGESFISAAGEASLMVSLRTEFLVRRSHPREVARIAAYWKCGTSAHHQNLE